MLKISKEYKFQFGGSVFYAVEGDSIKVRLKTGEIIVGELITVDIESKCFDLDTEDSTENGITTIDCENVIDIIPV